MKNASVTGVISSCTASHYNGMPDTPEQYLEIGVVESFPCPNDDSYGVAVELDADSVWTVTGDSYLRRLSIEESTSIRGAELFVNGNPAPFAPGVYEGKIALKVK